MVIFIENSPFTDSRVNNLLSKQITGSTIKFNIKKDSTKRLRNATETLETQCIFQIETETSAIAFTVDFIGFLGLCRREMNT